MTFFSKVVGKNLSINKTRKGKKPERSSPSEKCVCEWINQVKDKDIIKLTTVAKSKRKTMASMKERYIASMVLCGTGDAMGYYHGEIEFCTNIKKILKMIDSLSGGKGVMALDISGDDWLISDGKQPNFKNLTASYHHY